MDEVWYRAMATVEHDGARFEAGALVGWQHPAVTAHPDAFERVRVAPDGAVVGVMGGPPILSRAVPAVLMSDGTTRPLPPAPSGPPAAASPSRRRVGRPAWTEDLFRARYAAAKSATTPPTSTGKIADNFVRLDGTKGIEPASLARLLRNHGE